MIDLKIDKSESKDLEEAAKLLSARQFGDAVAKRIKELRWVQRDLAEAIFTGQPVISQIVRGDYPNLTLDWVTRLAKALKMEPSELAKAYWKEEDKEISEQNKEVIERIRELLTNYYQIGGHQQEGEPLPPLPTNQHPANKETYSGLEDAKVENRKRTQSKKQPAPKPDLEDNV